MSRTFKQFLILLLIVLFLIVALEVYAVSKAGFAKAAIVSETVKRVKTTVSNIVTLVMNPRYVIATALLAIYSVIPLGFLLGLASWITGKNLKPTDSGKLTLPDWAGEGHLG